MRQEFASTLSRLLDWLLPKSLLLADVESRRRARLVVGFTAALVIWGPIFSVIYFALGLPQFSIAVLIAAALGTANIAAFRFTGSIRWAGNLTTLDLFCIIAYLAVCSDGANSPVISWFVPIPMLATMMLGYRFGIAWLMVSLATFVVLFIEAGSQWPIVEPLSPRQSLLWGFSAVTAITMVVYSLSLIYEKLKDSALQKLFAASRAKSEFLANMSHEIRTPLTAILGYTDVLLEEAIEGCSQERLQENVGTIKRAGEHLLTIVNDILDLSKIEAGKLKVEQIECDLPLALSELAGLMSARAAAKQLSFKVRLASEIPRRVRTDPTRLRQILLNLVGNAVKFTEHGGVEITLAVAGAGADSVLEIDILDSGLGISPEHASQLFSPFMQADTSLTRRFGGTGLGLAICRRLANLMGGAIYLAHSAPGEGSQFRLVLPLNAMPDTSWVSSLECAAAALQTHAAATAQQSKLTALRGRVLLAEDGKENQLLIAYYMRKAGVELDIAENGRIALAMLEDAAACVNTSRRPYDLLLTDMQMPEMDGYTLAEILRREGSSIPIIALTANAMAEDRNKCLVAGCNDYTTKPVNKAELLAKCAQWLGSKPEHSAAAELAS